MFDAFIERLKNRFSEGLPGQEAQYKMVPPERERTDLNELTDHNPKEAAVLALIYEKENEPHMVFMKRNSYPGVHSDQISFPGGKYEKEDVNLKFTALRESHEELGIIPEQVNIVGELTKVYIPPSNFLVLPFLGYTKDPIRFVPDKKEVTEVLEFPLSRFKGSASIEPVSVDARGTTFNVPAYVVQNHIIWGATAMMMSEISTILDGMD